MRRCVLLLFVASLLGSCAAKVGKPSGVSTEKALSSDKVLKVMTFNIRCVSQSDKQDIWFNRKEEVAALILRHDPDLLGMQEVTQPQMEFLQGALSDYEGFGVARDDGVKAGERCPVFFKRARFEKLREETFWLSETPEIPGSRSWNAACRRIVTWAQFKDRSTGQVFFLFNTHFDHVSETARKESAKLILARIGTISEGAPCMVTGDFNSGPESAAFTTLTQSLQDSRAHSETPPKGPEGTTRGFSLQSEVGHRIDYVFTTPGIKILEYAALEDTYGEGRRPSDHLPVLVKMSW